MATQAAPAFRVTIVDDDEDGRDELMDNLRDWHFEPMAVMGQFGDDMNRLLAEIRSKNSSFVICDHRLQPKGLASFYGAAVVEQLVRTGTPAMLLTMFQSANRLDLRAHRHAVPVVVGRDAFRPDLVPEYAEICRREIELDPVEERKPHRVLIRVEDVHRGDHGVRIDAVIPTWSHDRAVVIPNECLDPSIVSELRRGVRLMGDVNVGAESEDDLFFKNVNEVGPPPKEI